MRRISCLSLLCLGFIPPTDGQTAETTTLDEMVVTATRFPAKRSTIPTQITTISREEIAESHATSIPDLLRGQAGLHVVDITGNSRYFNVDLRGFGETSGYNTLVLVDGRRINQADLSGVDWLQIPLARVEKIEIIRGGSAGALYGDNATGGVVNIITRSGGQESGREIQFEAGSHGLATTRMHLDETHNDLSYALSAGFKNLDGFRDNSDLEARDTGLKLRYQAHDALALNLSAGYQTDTSRLPSAIKESDLAKGINRKATTTPNQSAEVTDYHIQITPELRLSEHAQFTMDLSKRNRDQLFNPFNFRSEIDSWMLAPRLRIDRAWGGINDQVTVGLDYQDVEARIGSDDLGKESLGIYAHNELRLSPQWTWTQAFRHDRAEFQFAAYQPDRVHRNEQSYSTGIAYEPDASNRLHVNFSRSFRFPLLDEFFVFDTTTFMVNVNTAIRPQQAQEWQTGWRHTWNPTLKGEINLFRVVTRDEIYYDLMAGVNTNLNGTVTRDGLELQMEKQFESWSLTGYTTWTKAEIDSGTYAGKRMPGVAGFKGGGTLRYFPWEQQTWELDGRYIGSRPYISDFANGYGEQAGYWLLDASVRHQWSNTTGWLKVNNLTGREYAEFGGLSFGFPPERGWFASPGRTFLVGVTSHF
ncbi:Vitamin B12 transporter BtuB [Candidatus Magnetaquicoccaceae bacterium FCR-1]|uniref:Vitamin B12 transporter BtuB n=1 Tax=Candidatus Magnetaquiglobus chichijimensis TaxID=3141448 RepID=A0ABQ0C6C9_9PROT